MTFSVQNELPGKDKEASCQRPTAVATLMAAEVKFPRPVQLGERRIAYLRSEAEAFIDERIAARAAS
jgi:hypothetical protein